MLRRSIDLVASLAGLILCAPLFVPVALAVRLSSRGPVFHRSRRVGRSGRPFTMYKFRTMRVGSDSGPPLTRRDDARTTAVGRLLRRTKLDEIPQLINVLVGDMSLVGPRPEDPRFVALYDEEQSRLLEVRPGITSPASLRFRDESEMLSGPDWEQVYVEAILPLKLKIDLEYEARRNVFSDIAVIARTIARAPGPKF